MKILGFIFRVLFYLFIVSLFLTGGADTPGLYISRLWLGFILVCLFIAFYRERMLPAAFSNLPFILFLCFLSFVMLRGVWAYASLYRGHVPDDEVEFLRRFVRAPAIWGGYFALFTVSLVFFSTRERVYHLLITLAASGMLLAMTVIPPVLIHQTFRPKYIDAAGEYSFFPPFFYFHDFVSQFVLTRAVHVNWLGDVMAFGLFSALGLALYTSELIRRNKREAEHKSIESEDNKLWPLCILAGCVVFTIASAIILLLARGTTVSVALGLFLCFAASLLKFPSWGRLKFSILAAFLVLAFLFWAGNLQKSWLEVQTVAVDLDASKPSSLATNREAARVALSIYGDHALWGVGTNGFSALGWQYAKPSAYPLAMFQAMSHYLQTLAEEGLGAYIYLLFLLSYILLTTKNLIQTQSHFKFVMGLALFCLVLSLLIHGSVHHFLARFPVAALLYIVMGASLAIFRTDFRNEGSPGLAT